MPASEMNPSLLVCQSIPESGEHHVLSSSKRPLVSENKSWRRPLIIVIDCLPELSVFKRKGKLFWLCSTKSGCCRLPSLVWTNRGCVIIVFKGSGEFSPFLFFYLFFSIVNDSSALDVADTFRIEDDTLILKRYLARVTLVSSVIIHVDCVGKLANGSPLI